MNGATSGIHIVVGGLIFFPASVVQHPRTRCFRENTIVESWPATDSVPPKCPTCGAYLRPDVVWFGESLPEGVFEEAVHVSRECDVFFSIGTSSVVFPAASLPYEAAQGGAVVVEINPDETGLTGEAAFSFRARSGEFLPRLVAAAWPG